MENFVKEKIYTAADLQMVYRIVVLQLPWEEFFFIFSLQYLEQPQDP